MDSDSGWKVAKPKNNNSNQRNNNNNNRNFQKQKPNKQFTTSISPTLFTDIDKQYTEFGALSESDRGKKCKELWDRTKKSIVKIISAPDFTSIILPIYLSIDPYDNSHNSQVTNDNVLVKIFSRFHHDYDDSDDQASYPAQTTIISPNTTDPPPKINSIDFKSYILSLIRNNLNATTTEQPTPSQSSSSLPHQSTYSFTHSSLGIGSIITSASSILQFAVYLIIISLFPTTTLPLIYDPMFTPLDCYLFQSLGLVVMDNTEGRLPVKDIYPLLNESITTKENSNDNNNNNNNNTIVDNSVLLDSTKTNCTDQTNHETITSVQPITKHISFIPHCPIGISHNVLQSLWVSQIIQPVDMDVDSSSLSGQISTDVDSLLPLSGQISSSYDFIPNLILIANSFDQIMMKTIVPNKYHQVVNLCEEYLQPTTMTMPNQSNKKKNNKKKKDDDDDQLSSSSLDLFKRFYQFTCDPYFYYGFDQYLSFISTQPKSSSPQTSSNFSPSMSLLLLKPWVHEIKLNFNSNNSILNDMGIHSFTMLKSLKSQNPINNTIINIIPNNNNNMNPYGTNNTDSTVLNKESSNVWTQTPIETLLTMCPLIPHFIPPPSDNPELIPASLRSK